MENPEPVLIDSGVAAMLLHTSPDNVRQMIKRGKLSKHGTAKRRSLVRYEDVLALQKQRNG